MDNCEVIYINQKSDNIMVINSKKGASQADWAISLGIFLLYVLSMMMIIQPGAAPIYKEDKLLVVVKDSYKSDTAYTYYKTPAFIVLNPSPDGFKDGGDLTITFKGDLPFSGDGNNYGITDASGTEIRNVWISLSDVPGEDIISFDSFINSALTFYIISNKRADGMSDSYEVGRSLPVNPAEISDEITADHPVKNFTVTFGSTESMTGVDGRQLTTNVPDGVKCEDEDTYSLVLKNKWSFPGSKDFNIYYVGTSDPKYSAADVTDVCSQAVPYAQASVFTEEWATNIIDQYGAVTAIRMGVKVW